MARIQIRLAKSSDWNALAEMRYQFRAELGSTTESKSRFARRFTSWVQKHFNCSPSIWRCWVLDDGKELLGHVCVQLFQKMPNPINEPELHAYLTNFYVIPEMRSHGLGRQLLNKALSWCRSQEVSNHSVGNPRKQIALSPVRFGQLCGYFRAATCCVSAALAPLVK